MSGNSLEWFQSYLENRIQQCSVGGSLSDSRVLTRGVPQGTILGPLLFLLYINDIPNCLSHCEPRMYAHDTHLTYADNYIGSIELCLSEDLLNVHTWLNANKLTLNMTKTEFMLIESDQRPNTIAASPSVLMNSTHVKEVATTKSLGITTDDKLSWNCHIEKLTKKIASGIGAMKRCKKSCKNCRIEQPVS